jgi:hypothetical protein
MEYHLSTQSGYLKKISTQGVWQELIQNKYLHFQTLSQVSAKPTDSPFSERTDESQGRFFQSGFFQGWGW